MTALKKAELTSRKSVKINVEERERKLLSTSTPYLQTIFLFHFMHSFAKFKHVGVRLLECWPEQGSLSYCHLSFPCIIFRF